VAGRAAGDRAGVSGPSDPAPLVVDLDGTLLRADTLHESALRFAGTAPWRALALPFWLARGKAHLKRRLAEHVELAVGRLPANDALVAWLREQRAAGRRLVLCTAADRAVADAVAARFGIFDEVIASDGTTNLDGPRKADALVRRFGPRGFDYAGNAAVDLAVWRHARRAVVVGSERLGARAAGVAEVERRFDPRAGGPRDWVRALRLHQWAKNLLVVLPLLASHLAVAEPLRLLDAAVAFLAFGLCASSVYILNDLIDLDSDRAHPRKRRRPFASGALPAHRGIAASLLLVAAAFAVGSFTRPAFLAWLATYLALTLYYTFVLKRKILVDALALAALYTLRILAGGAAVGVWPGFWLLALSLFLFLSLAFAKRYSELGLVLDRGGDAAHGRDYRTTDLPLIESFGVVSGFAAVIVLALYMNGESVARLYASESIVWLTVPILLYWVTRVWVKAHRGELHDDPVVFALTDGLSLLSIGAFVAVLAVASYAW
jgi:4-hydroxybenzoate polyprenyltransferase/limonene-1,2-epoxide hydrolase